MCFYGETPDVIVEIWRDGGVAAHVHLTRLPRRFGFGAMGSPGSFDVWGWIVGRDNWRSRFSRFVGKNEFTSRFDPLRYREMFP